MNTKGGNDAALFVMWSYLSSPSLRANGSRECAPDDRLREAIQNAMKKDLDCFVALAPRIDGEASACRINRSRLAAPPMAAARCRVPARSRSLLHIREWCGRRKTRPFARR